VLSGVCEEDQVHLLVLVSVLLLEIEIALGLDCLDALGQVLETVGLVKVTKDDSHL